MTTDSSDHSAQSELNCPEKHLGTKLSETKILCLTWDKQKDTFEICTPIYSQRLTESNVLKAISIYHTLGFISLVLLKGKILFQNLCNMKIG